MRISKANGGWKSTKGIDRTAVKVEAFFTTSGFVKIYGTLYCTSNLWTAWPKNIFNWLGIANILSCRLDKSSNYEPILVRWQKIHKNVILQFLRIPVLEFLFFGKFLCSIDGLHVTSRAACQTAGRQNRGWALCKCMQKHSKDTECIFSL